VHDAYLFCLGLNKIGSYFSETNFENWENWENFGKLG
jgi:hypothetical protein